MNSTKRPLLLEQYFFDVASKKTEEFPGSSDYSSHYSSLLSVLRQSFYPHINVGLSTNSGSIAGVYTDHSGDHFDEVVKYAGKLTGLTSSVPPTNFPLRPFEVYLLLMGIRLHDVGNLYGRNEHEKKALLVYKKSTASANRDKFETQVISKIAEVHGGKTSDGSKDTISQLYETDSLGSSTQFRPRVVAALVRFADEICEHRGRVQEHLIESGNIPEQNLIFHLYAASIRSSSVDRHEKAIKLQYVLHKKYLQKPYKLPDEKQKPKYLIDETLERLSKLNMERIYCNQFLPPELQTDRIIADITIVDGEDGEIECETRTIHIKAQGYPTEDKSWRSQVTDFSGILIKKKYGRKGK